MIVAMFLFSIAAGVAAWSITISRLTKTTEWLLFLILAWICVMGGAIALDSTPANKDVREGDAHYVEQNHIEVINGDTINNYKTYKIEWNEN